MSHIDIRGE